VSSRPTDAPRRRAPPSIFLEIDHALRANDLGRAIALAHRALDDGHSDPVLFNLRAHWRKHNGYPFDALADLEQARRLDPESAQTVGALADCLNALGHHKKALAAADEALALDTTNPTAWFQKALAHQMLNELDAARTGYLEAIRLDPRMADALARLAAMELQQGETDAARIHADRALAVRPGHEIAHLTHIALDLDAAEPRIQSLLANRQTTPLTRAIALSHLGDLRDSQDRPADAFTAYREAGTVWHGVYDSHFARPELEAVPQMLDQLNTALAGAPAWQAPDAAGNDNDASLAFILGFPRSGTTLLGQVLASRKDVVLFEEKPLLARAIADFVAAIDGPEKLAALPDAALESYRADFWQRVANRGIETRGKMVIEQTAFNTAYLTLIRRLFPRAPIVFALRDPRDVVFSCFRRLFAPNQFTVEMHSLESAARLYDATMRHAELCRTKLGFEPLDLRNEDLIADFDGTTRTLCAHLGLPWDGGMREYQHAARGRTLATRSATQVRRGISKDGVGQWRRYRDHLAPVLPLLETWAQRYGY
jgi:tetratricopeptide (TPR) repeat protein